MIDGQSKPEGKKRLGLNLNWEKLHPLPTEKSPSQTDAILKSADRMRRESLTDDKAQAFSRRYLTKFIESLQQKQEDNEANQRDIGIVFVDLDDLKTINDSEGHEAGDQLLSKASDLLRKIAPTDVETYLSGKITTKSGKVVVNSRTGVRDNFLVRRGGDEFTIVCINEENEPDFLEKLESKMKDLQKLAEKEGVKFSYGVSVCSKNHLVTQLESTIDEADRSMQQQKGQRKGWWYKFAKNIFRIMTGKSR